MSVVKRFHPVSVLSFFSMMLLLQVSGAFAGEADIILPDLSTVKFSIFGGLNGLSIMYFGILVCFIGLIFSITQASQTKNLPCHKAMLGIRNHLANMQILSSPAGKFLIILWVLIAICMVYYFMGLSHAPFGNMVIILLCSILGILGSYGVAWFGMRINTWANSDTFSRPFEGSVDVVNILTSGMSVGLLLISVELSS